MRKQNKWSRYLLWVLVCASRASFYQPICQVVDVDRHCTDALMLANGKNSWYGSGSHNGSRILSACRQRHAARDTPALLLRSGRCKWKWKPPNTLFESANSDAVSVPCEASFSFQLGLIQGYPSYATCWQVFGGMYSIIFLVLAPHLRKTSKIFFGAQCIFLRLWNPGKAFFFTMPGRKQQHTILEVQRRL